MASSCDCRAADCTDSDELHVFRAIGSGCLCDLEHYVVKHGVDITKPFTLSERTPDSPKFVIHFLHLACELGHDYLLDYLLSAGARIEGWDDRERGALYVAAYHVQLPCVKKLVEVGADVNAKSGLVNPDVVRDGGKSWRDLPVLFGAVNARETKEKRAEWLEMVKWLVAVDGVDIDGRDCDGNTVGMSAARMGDIELMRILKAAGADMMAVNRAGQNMMSLAMQFKQRDMFLWLASEDLW